MEIIRLIVRKNGNIRAYTACREITIITSSVVGWPESCLDAKAKENE